MADWDELLASIESDLPTNNKREIKASHLRDLFSNLVTLARPVLSLDDAEGDSVYLLDGPRSGYFDWNPNDLSSIIMQGETNLDPRQAVYVTRTGDATDGSEGAWVRRVGDTYDERWWGIARDGSDETEIWQDICLFFSKTGGRVRCGPGTCLIGTVIFEQNLILEGSGYYGLTIGRSTIFRIKTGQSGFVCRRRSGGYAGGGFKRMNFVAQSKNTTATTGSMAAASKTLTLASAGDFEDGQLIIVRGANSPSDLMHTRYMSAATTEGSEVITLSGSAGLVPGMRISVEGAAFPENTFVVSRDGTEVTLSEQAGATVAAGTITYYNDLCAQIISGGGTTELTLNEAANQAVEGAAVEHYDCAIYSTSGAVKIEDVHGEGFTGAVAFYHGGSDVDNPTGFSTNSNNSRINNLSGDNNRNVLRIVGNDGNAGSIFGLNGYSNIEYVLVDASLLGNYYFGCHASGPYGYMVVFPNALATIVASYTEGGTHNTFAYNTYISGGLMGGPYMGGVWATADQGSAVSSGLKIFQDWFTGNKLLIGNSASGGIPFQIDASDHGGSDTIQFRRSSSGHGQKGLWGWWVGGAVTGAGLLFGDSDSDIGAGQVILRDGFYAGNNSGTFTQSNFKAVKWRSAIPTTGTWARGDIVYFTAPSAGGFVGAVCTSGGSPGTWKNFGAIEP